MGDRQFAHSDLIRCLGERLASSGTLTRRGRASLSVVHSDWVRRVDQEIVCLYVCTKLLVHRRRGSAFVSQGCARPRSSITSRRRRSAGLEAHTGVGDPSLTYY
ncbi:hypothetical protein Zmor_003358 [Zophobas morio]|uniref:Uncharacterized protein n=1 Tax=Zophobas morio TaxID=2755281 RepID=A0AA38HLH9_9CUCU|nr:hypothetical protein Zmor_003358 [Zophobas morio]